MNRSPYDTELRVYDEQLRNRIMTVEKKASEIVVGDVLIGKSDDHRRFIVTGIMPGIGEKPYLTLKDAEGNIREHDTSFDSSMATYTVETQS